MGVARGVLSAAVVSSGDTVTTVDVLSGMSPQISRTGCLLLECLFLQKRCRQLANLVPPSEIMNLSVTLTSCRIHIETSGNIFKDTRSSNDVAKLTTLVLTDGNYSQVDNENPLTFEFEKLLSKVRTI